MNVLFLCTGNSARSIMAEALLNVLGQGRFVAFSAGSQPTGKVQPLAIELATGLGYPAKNLRSKSWDEFAAADAPPMDMIITVCDNAAGESCPVWPGQPATAHWGVPDPAALQGDGATRRAAFVRAFALLRQRVQLLVAQPDAKLEGMCVGRVLRDIAERTT